MDNQLGLERTPEEYVERLVGVFREVWRVLRDDATVWLNLGDCYANDGKWGGETGGKQHYLGEVNRKRVGRERRVTGLKPKSLVMIPARVAMALQADGWCLRSDIIWAKPNPMPESVADRPTKAHEHLFLLVKAEKYYYDADAIREPGVLDGHDSTEARQSRAHPGQKSNPDSRRNGIRPKLDKQRGHGRRHAGFNDRWDAMTRKEQCSMGRNKRDVWTISTQPTPEAHFAVFPEALVEPCVLAGSAPGDVVLDPFGGTGTTVRVAQRLGRKGVALELSAKYCKMAVEKTWQSARQGQMF